MSRSKYYNHSLWSSPFAKIVVSTLELDIKPDGTKIKRITHDQALEILRQQTKSSTIKEFLAIPKLEVEKILLTPERCKKYSSNIAKYNNSSYIYDNPLRSRYN